MLKTLCASLQLYDRHLTKPQYHHYLTGATKSSFFIFTFGILTESSKNTDNLAKINLKIKKNKIGIFSSRNVFCKIIWGNNNFFLKKVNYNWYIFYVLGDSGLKIFSEGAEKKKSIYICFYKSAGESIALDVNFPGVKKGL